VVVDTDTVVDPGTMTRRRVNNNLTAGEISLLVVLCYATIASLAMFTS
jgi:hypothetical protein